MFLNLNVLLVLKQSVREEMTRMKTQLADTNHRLSQLQTFRSSVARLLHLRDVPHEGILQRLQTLYNAHQVRNIYNYPIITNPFPTTFPRNSHCCRVATSQPHPSGIIHVLGTTIWFHRRFIAAQSVRRPVTIITTIDCHRSHTQLVFDTRSPHWMSITMMISITPRNFIIITKHKKKTQIDK